MDVFLVPIGAERYELYCEVPDEPPDERDANAPRWSWRRVRFWFHQMLAEAEHQRRHGRPELDRPSWLGRLKAKFMRWMAEAIAEQRLLWHLRRQTRATLFYPDDMQEAAAVAFLRRQLSRDFEKHRFWLAIDSLGAAGSLALVLVPGPNFIGYYFTFRMVGHFLSVRGARNGLNKVTWTHERSEPLSDLRRALQLQADARESHVRGVADRLRLEHLATFFERTAIS